MAHTWEQRGRDGKPRYWGACRLPDGTRMRYSIFLTQQEAMAWAVAEETKAAEAATSGNPPPRR
jgi:hypothetical protein